MSASLHQQQAALHLYLQCSDVGLTGRGCSTLCGVSEVRVSHANAMKRTTRSPGWKASWLRSRTTGGKAPKCTQRDGPLIS